MAGTKPSPSKKTLSMQPRLEAHASRSFRLNSSSLNSVRLRRIFDHFDRNGDGIITADELRQALESLGLGADPAETQSLIASYIASGSAGLDFDDFHSLHCALGDAIFGGDDGSSAAGEESEEDDMREAFRVFDEDGDGYISANELQAVMGKLGMVEWRSIDRVHRMIGSVDQDHDGRVDFFEFKNMMKSIAVQGS